jgi:hypothetical protein
MSDDDRSLRWRKTNVPLITNGNQIVIRMFMAVQRVTLTELYMVTVASCCYWDEVVCLAIYCSHTVDHLSKPTRKRNKRRTTTRPVGGRTWITICCASEEWVRCEIRGLRRTESSNALPLGDLAINEPDGRCSVYSRCKQRGKDEESSQHFCDPWSGNN